MSHELEIVDGKARIAYSGETPWHTLGTDVSGKQLTPMQMCEISGNDWLTEKRQAFIFMDKDSRGRPTKPVKIDAMGLVRVTDGKVLDTVTTDWEPVQNHEAMEFFNEFVAAGEMEMETVGSLKGGTIVWGLAKVKESFELFKGDKVDSYLLFTNFHKYGFSTDVRFTPVRVVCHNTLCLSLDKKVERMVKYTHRRKFNPEAVKLTLGVAKEKLAKYKEMAAFLGSKKAKEEDIVEYLKRIMPGSKDKLKEMGRNAETTLALLETQPGAQYAKGSWWQAYNSVSFFMDHIVCKTDDQRLKQAWYGSHKSLKVKALELALDYAGK